MSHQHRNASVCDHGPCDTWTRHPEDHGFLTVWWGDLPLVFCSPDHVIAHLAATTEPMEVIE